RPHDLRAQRLPGRQLGHRPQVLRLEHLAVDHPDLDRQRRVGPHEGRERLRRRHRVAPHDHQAGGAGQVLAERRQRRVGDRDPGQPVLHDAVLGRRRPELLPQLRELLDGEAPVLRQHRRLHAGDAGLQLRDLVRLRCRRHPGSPYFLNWFATRWTSTGTPGPIVVETVMLRRYCPFAPDGLAFTSASRTACAFAISRSPGNDFLPTGTWTLPALSTLNSTLPALTSRTARATSKVTVPTLGFGMSPRGRSIFPSRPTWPMRSGVATAVSKSSQPPWIFSTMSSAPTKSAPASRASRSFSPLANTSTRTDLPVPWGSTTAPRTIWSAYLGLTPRRTASSTVSSNFA